MARLEEMMGKLARFGVSLDEELLADFDNFCKRREYGTRSEALRDLIRGALNDDQWGKSGLCGGTLTLVYDHHRHDLARKLMAIQHEYHDVIVATMHVHVDHHNCMECLALKGDADSVRTLAQRLASCRGVKYSAFNRAPNGEDLR